MSVSYLLPIVFTPWWTGPLRSLYCPTFTVGLVFYVLTLPQDQYKNLSRKLPDTRLSVIRVVWKFWLNLLTWYERSNMYFTWQDISNYPLRNVKCIIAPHFSIFGRGEWRFRPKMEISIFFRGAGLSILDPVSRYHNSAISWPIELKFFVVSLQCSRVQFIV